jgi:hypothetical protein
VERTHWTTLGGPNLDMPGDTGDLLLKDGYYQDPAQKDGARFLLKAVDPKFYVAQDCGAPDGPCIFVLMRIEGREVYSYDSDCSEETMLAFAPTGAIDRVEGNRLTRTCYLGSLASLMTIFRSLEAGTPRGKSIVE